MGLPARSPTTNSKPSRPGVIVMNDEVLSGFRPKSKLLIFRAPRRIRDAVGCRIFAKVFSLAQKLRPNQRQGHQQIHGFRGNYRQPAFSRFGQIIRVRPAPQRSGDHNVYWALVFLIIAMLAGVWALGRCICCRGYSQDLVLCFFISLHSIA